MQAIPAAVTKHLGTGNVQPLKLSEFLKAGFKAS